MVGGFLKRLLGAKPLGDQRSAATSPVIPEADDVYSPLPDGRLVNWSEVSRLLDARILDGRTAMLADALQKLTQADPAGPLGPVVVAEKSVQNLEEVAPGHPMLSAARATIANYADKFANALPALREVGQIADVCPTCMAALKTRPQRKAKCPSCGTAIFARTRPIDGAKVLLSESDLIALEEDWVTDYKVKQRQPRPIDPVWAERIAVARSSGPHADPAVEAAAQRVFAAIRAASQSEAPHDAKERLLSDFVDVHFREQVDIRVWQLQVQSMG
jgi:DNA-directed RNA polymerase subunit RPC12/RpoP